MPGFKEHCQDCRNELGEPFENVHAWLDELQAEYGPMHRSVRHNTEGVERVRAMWGDRAARAAEIHILKDCGGVIMSKQELRDYWGVDPEDIAAENSS